MHWKYLALTAVVGASTLSSAHGAMLAYDNTGVKVDAGTNAGNLNIGREFTVGAGGITVQALGAYDQGDDGLVSGHTVTLFSITGSGANPAPLSAIISAPVDSGTTDLLSGGFRLKAIAPTFLAPGNYAVVVYGFNANADTFGNGGGTPANANVTDLHFDPFEFSAAVSPAFPSAQGDSNDHSSTSFTYDIGNTTPEPATLGLLSLSTMGLLARRRR